LLLQARTVDEMDGKQDVKLYIYDVSNGLARSLSPVLLGESYRLFTPPTWTRQDCLVLSVSVV